MAGFHKMRLRNKLFSGFAVPAVLTVVLSLLMLFSLNRLGDASKWVDHTYVAINYGDTLLSSMVDTETGFRGYLITGDEVFLEPYYGGIDSFESTYQNAVKHVSDNPTQVDRLNTIRTLKKQWLANHAKPAMAIRNQANADGNTSAVSEFIGRGLGKASMDQLRVEVADFTNAEKVLIELRQAAAKKLSSIASLIAIIGGALAVMGSIAIVFSITRSVTRQLGAEPRDIKDIAQAIAKGDLSQDLSTERPATGVLQAMKTMQQNLQERHAHDEKIKTQMSRITQALDNTSSAVIVAECNGEVVFQNKAAAALFKTQESEIKSAVPSFTASKLVGGCFLGFASSAGLSSTDIDALTASVTRQSSYGKTTFRQIYSPIVGDGGERLGTVVEWSDRTERLSVEREIQSLVDLALAGDLSQRVNTETKEGFFRMLGEGINSLVSVCDNVVNDTVRMFEALSRGDLTQSVNADYQGAFAKVRDNANDTVAQLTDVISKVKTGAGALDGESSQLKQRNQLMFENAELATSQATSVSSAVEQINANITGVASAATQMSASISEISRNSSDATRIAQDAVSLAESTELTVRQLSTSSGDIGAVVKVINSIAEQTNLLALNATIEAARAGDAGKGFAVVANEVKDLAKETAKATDEISDKVAAIQSDSENAVTKISDIDRIIGEINNIQRVIATAVEEQSSVTSAISRSVNEAADGIADIESTTVSAVDGAKQSLESTEKAQKSTASVSSLAGELRTLVDNFTVK